MSESSFWDYLRPLLPPDIHYDRIESDTSPGHPDVRYTLEGVTGTIELKSAKAKHRKKAKPFSGRDDGLRKAQIDWMWRETVAQGLVWIFAEVGPVVYVIDGGLYADDFNSFSIDDLRRVQVLWWDKKLVSPTGITRSIYSTLLDISPRQSN